MQLWLDGPKQSTWTLRSTDQRTLIPLQTLGLIANNMKCTNSAGVTSALKSLIKSVRITPTAVFVDTHGRGMIRKSGSRVKLPVDAKLIRRHLRLKILTGVISAMLSLIKTVARTPTVVSADGVGPRMIVLVIDPRTPSAAARSMSDSSKITNLSGATIAKT